MRRKVPLALQRLDEMPPPFSPGILVEYAGARWRVLRVMGAESVLLRADTGEEVSADPVKIRLADSRTRTGPSWLSDELPYSNADWAEATRRRGILRALARRPRRRT